MYISAHAHPPVAGSYHVYGAADTLVTFTTEELYNDK